MRRLSPLSQKVTLREIRQGAGASLENCLRAEFRMVHHCCMGRTDFTEGVTALLIEKRGQAHWDPPSIEQVPLTCAWPHACICLHKDVFRYFQSDVSGSLKRRSSACSHVTSLLECRSRLGWWMLSSSLCRKSFSCLALARLWRVCSSDRELKSWLACTCT